MKRNLAQNRKHVSQVCVEEASLKVWGFEGFGFGF